MATATESPERTFGPVALRLNPRALLGAQSGAQPGTRPAPGLDDAPAGRPERVAVALDPGGLTRAEREHLEAWESGTLVPFAPEGPAGGGAGEIALECHRAELRERAARDPVADVLLAAVEQREAPPAPPLLMGVVNVTPDSFSDGGRFLDPERAIEQAERLAREGAAILDVGGESTRPGARPVPAHEELERVVPVLRGLADRTRAELSIDTTKSEVAAAALALGARLVNDVSAGLADGGMLDLVAGARCRYVLMHRKGTSETMQERPAYADPVAEVARFLRERAAACLKAGVERPRIVVDPGIGFGKRLDHNLALLRRLGELRSLGLPLCLGVSRKSFIGHLTGSEEQRDWKGLGRADRPRDRIGGTAAALFACVSGGAEILRVHDVRVMAEALQVALALLPPRLHPA